MGSISFLLGAGFSANYGYPVGKQINDTFISLNFDSFSFHTTGDLVFNRDGSRPVFPYKNSYQRNFEFLVELIQYYYKSRNHFCYEEFYDFIEINAAADPKVSEIGNKYLGAYFSTVQDLVYGIKNILNQILSNYIKDINGDRFYDGVAHACGPAFPGYTGILNCLQKLGEKNILNIHTLNHDLFFERFNISDWLQGNLCDGFEELGSPFYGELKVENRNYKCRLAYYTGNYDTNFRLYKLHGSLDYAIFHGSKGSIMTPENYIKTRYGIGFSYFYKEVEQNNQLTYQRDWINYHADFLTGTTRKILRYDEPLLYKRLFELFEINLQNADKLIIIGYGGGDSEVNKLILKNFNSLNKPSFVIDPYPGENIKRLAKELNSTLIIKDLEQIELQDLK